MPRRAIIARRNLEQDPVYGSQLVTQLVNKVLKDGKKSTAESVVYDALERIRDRTGRDPVAVMEEAVRNVTPVLEVKSRRVGGATYQVPIEVPPRRARTLAIRWVVRYSRERREKQMSERLANELLDALGSQGGAFKRKDDLYRMAQANKAFAHYRW
jgi:small subunit ribosomal protein S7